MRRHMTSSAISRQSVRPMPRFSKVLASELNFQIGMKRTSINNYLKELLSLVLFFYIFLELHHLQKMRTNPL